MRSLTPGIILLSFLLAACQPQTKPTIKPYVADLSSFESLLEWPSSARTLNIDVPSSTLHILVYKAGRLARLGHNHIVSAHNFEGSVDVNPQLSKSGFQITLPVNRLIMDVEDLRAYYGVDFDSKLTQDQKSATLKNMLGPNLLDAEQHPFIKIESSRLSGHLPMLSVELAVTIKGVTRKIPVTVTMLKKADKIYARGQFDLLQSDFNIKPFSIFSGAIAVDDRLTINFNLVTRQS